MALQPILMPIVSVFKSQGIKSAQGAVAGLSKNFGQLAGTLGKAAGAFAGFQAISSSRSFVIDSVEATQKFERNLLALQQTFETATPGLMRFTQEVENYGLSQQQASQASVFLGSVLKQYGFSVDESADQTERLVTLAQDLATTYGYDVQDSLLAITALFRGEYDPIEKFGVAMKQNEINAYLAAQGLGDLEGAELANAQATARLTLLFERAQDSVGAFARASDTLYGSQQRLNAVMGNLQVAFGSAFQKPLADVNNALANVAQDGGEHLVDISVELGNVIESLAPSVEALGGALLSIISPFEQIIALSGGVVSALGKIFTPILNLVGGAFDEVSLFLDAISTDLKVLDEAMKPKPGDPTLLDQLNEITFLDLTQVTKAVDDFFGFFDKMEKDFESTTKLKEAMLFDGKQATEARRDAILIERVSAQAKAYAAAAEEAARKTAFYGNALKNLGFDAKDAEGNLIGIAGVFEEIELAARQSEAGTALEEIGFSAAQIENIITRPDWEQIFNDIASLAKIAALDIDKAFATSIGGAAMILNAQLALEQSIKTAFGAGEGSGGSAVNKLAKDTVKDFLDALQDEAMQQTARLQLEQMGASEGLIGKILGADDWLKIWIKIKQGIIVLDDLQDAFNRTAAGALELADAVKAIEEYDAAVAEINARLIETIKAINEQADALKLTFSDLLGSFDVLPTIAAEMGRFESAIVAQLASIESSLQSAFRNGDLFEEGYNELRKFARQELQLLQARQRQRDDMAERFSLSEGIISEYETAFTGALRLTNLFSQLKDETEKTTVTEVTKGVLSLSGSLKEFNVIVTREYEETITKVQDKTAGLLEGFKNMAVKARDFAANLRTLRDMGLDPQLFDQLVSAGVEAGGETAQALVDGGSETVNEISSIFAEMNELGADLGEEVATTLYGTGIDLADGLIEGILSKQDEMETAAYAMAEAFNAAFQATLSSEVGKVTASRVAEETAKAADEIAKIPVPELPKIDPALEQIDALIANANKALSGQLSSVFRSGVEGKLGAFEALRADIVSGSVNDLGGLTSGLTSAEVKSIATGTGGQTVNNYYNIVAPPASTRVESYSQGQAFEAGIVTFKASNSELTTAPIGG